MILKKIILFTAVSFVLYSCGSSIIQPENSPLVHIATGNTTKATENTSNSDNFLLLKPQFAMSYNNSFRHANWVSWELSTDWLGNADRSDDFRPDTDLPSSFTEVLASDYTSSGFDRGHLCPSADRTKNKTDNSATFVMSNMIPQSPELNRNAWANLESYSRKLANDGYLLYIIAGTYGTGGNGSKGDALKLKNNINVPERVYKIIVATKKNSVDELDKSTIVIATDFPNSDEIVQNRDWVRFVTTAEDIEKRAKVTFFSDISTSLSSDFKTRLFDYTKSPTTFDTACKQYNGRSLFVGSEGGCYYFNANGSKNYVTKSLCDCQ